MTVSEIIKETVEKYKLHHLDYADFWYKRDGILFMAEEIRNIGTTTWTFSFKPLYADELVYQIYEAGGGPSARYQWEQFKKRAALMRIRSGLTGPAKKICSSEYELPSAEEEYRKFYEKRFEDFMEMTKDIKDSDYATDTELSMINILAALHKKDYERATKLINKISSLGIGFLRAKNARPEEEILWHEEYPAWKKYLKKYIEGVKV